MRFHKKRMNDLRFTPTLHLSPHHRPYLLHHRDRIFLT